MITDGIENLGGMQWELLLSLFAAWLIIYLILGKGLSQNGKVWIRNLLDFKFLNNWIADQ